jgi:mono/diheme cytochrome c family protein
VSERILQGKGLKPVKGSSEAEEKLRAEPSELVAAVTREMSEPTDGLAPTPVGLVLFFFVLAGWAGYYLSSNSGGFNPNTYDEHYTGGANISEIPQPQDPVVLGRRTFNLCAQCHQENGLGLAGTYPPLSGSEIVMGDSQTLARILLHGLQGDIKVAGATYNGQMPGWDRLSDVQIAAVLTYVRSTWKNNAPPVDPALIAAIREQTAARTQSWTWQELREAAKTPVSVPGMDAPPPPK